MLDNIGLMNGLGSKMAYLQQRQTVIAGNIANADTPKYRPQDLETVDFGEIMRGTSARPKIGTSMTDSQHMPTTKSEEQADINKSRRVYEASPDGNAVIIEEQLLKAQSTQADFGLMTNLYKKNVSMINMAIGK
jgi:flagellar basal-body rod protein FlgB